MTAKEKEDMLWQCLIGAIAGNLIGDLVGAIIGVGVVLVVHIFNAIDVDFKDIRW